MAKTTHTALTRDGVFIRLGVLVTIGVMVLQTIFMSQAPASFLGNYTKSAFQRWFGLPCPLCGGTRAMHALFYGDVHRALYFNWIAIPVLILGIALVVIILIEFCLRRSLIPAIQLSRKAFTLCLIGFLLLWGLQIFQALYIPKPELLNPSGIFFKFYKFPDNR